MCLWLGCRVKWASIWSRPKSIFLGIIYVHPIGAVCLLRGSFCRRRVSAGVIDFTRLWLYCFGFILSTPFWPGSAVALVSVLYFRFTSVWNGFRDIVLGQVKGTQRPYDTLGFEIPLYYWPLKWVWNLDPYLDCKIRTRGFIPWNVTQKL